jgi:hypothetical protein
LGCLRRINRLEQQPFLFYVHPWEIDPDQPRLPAASRLSRFRHYVHLARNERKLDGLLSSFRFGRLSDVIAQRTPDAPPTDRPPASSPCPPETTVAVAEDKTPCRRS